MADQTQDPGNGTAQPNANAGDSSGPLYTAPQGGEDNGTTRAPTPQKSSPGRAARRRRSKPPGKKKPEQHAAEFDIMEADLDAQAQLDPGVGVSMATKQAVNRLVHGVDRTKALQQLSRVNSHEAILRILSYTMLRIMKRRLAPDEANAITRVCATAQKSLDVLGMSKREADALADLVPAEVESDADIRKRVNAGAPPAPPEDPGPAESEAADPESVPQESSEAPEMEQPE